ncbi:MAG: DNA internalization-related competence protein ComEC/Rec2 [Limnobacter sp.]|nr:DNA internalization-related competence protein ComEC/Rec2 [Limnobacter sp.]
MVPYLFALALGLTGGTISLHLQEALPFEWSPALTRPPVFFLTQATLIALVGFVVVQAAREGVSNHITTDQIKHKTSLRTRLSVLCVTGGLAAYVLGSLTAQNYLSFRVSPNCHTQSIRGEFVLEDVFLKGTQEVALLLRSVGPDSPCLRQGTLLQARAGLHPWQIGAQYQAQGNVRTPRAALQNQGFDVEFYWMSQGIHGHLQLKEQPIRVQAGHGWNLFAHLKQQRLNTIVWLLNQLPDSSSRALLIALITGDQGLLSPTDRQLFADTGIAHLVAISGLHITLLALVMSKAVSGAWRLSPQLVRRVNPFCAGPLIGLLFAAAYAFASGWAPPAQRTVLMLASAFVISLSGHRTSPWLIWLVPLVFLLLVDPFAVYDAGFLLSFGAVGILIFVHHLEHTVGSKPFPALREAIKSQYAVTIGLIPLSVFLFNQYSLVSPLVNALSIPWMSFVSTPLAVLGALARQDWLVNAAHETLAWQQVWLTFFVEWPMATLPMASQNGIVMVGVCLGCLILLLPKGLIPRWLGVLSLLSLIWPVDRPDTGDIWIEAHDVGQGAALTIRTRNHWMVYDTGPAFTESSNSGRRVVWPFHQHLGNRRLDALWLSHDDHDHTGGAAFLLEHMDIEALIAPFQARHALIDAAAKNGTPWANCNNHPSWRWDGVLFEPLPLALPESTKDNNRSCVLKISGRGGSILLTGDIEQTVETSLIQKYGSKLKASVMMVPHHGSKTSSSRAMIQAVQPSIAIVQAGWNNQFNHPHPEVLQRYRLAGAEVFSTAHHGAIHIQIRHRPKPTGVKCSRFSLKRYWHLHETSAFLSNRCQS